MPNMKDACGNCGCYYRDHIDQDGETGHCRGCGINGCSMYMPPSRTGIIRFIQLLKWTRSWLKTNKRRSIKKFRKNWQELHNIAYLCYCSVCKTPTIVNNETTRALFKKEEGLYCATCKCCSTCCECIECSVCHKNRVPHHFCPTIIDNEKHCVNCCKCRFCGKCNTQCGGNWCESCGNCLPHCPCLYTGRAPWYSQKPKFHSANKKQHIINPTNRFIAAEIEVAGIYGNGKRIYEVVKKWGGSIVRDGSLPENGFEINTAPASGDLFIEQINDICGVLSKEGSVVGNKCGLHIHLDAKDFDYYGIRRLVRTYAKIEKALFNMVPLDRSMSKYCRPCGEKFVQAIESGRLPYDKVKLDVIKGVYADETTHNRRNRKYDQARYVALNLHSWFYRKTIENRMFNGTIDPNDIINWGLMWAFILEYIAHSNDEKIANDLTDVPYDSLIKIVGENSRSKNVIEFIKKRTEMYSSKEIKQEPMREITL